MPNPYEHPELYKSIELGGQKSPGTVKLNGHERVIGWKKNDAKGQVGASMTLEGEPLGAFEADFELVRDIPAGIDDFTAWDAFQKLIESTTSGPQPIALPVYHPDLARNRYTHVVNAGVGGMIHDENGMGRVKVKFSEYRPPKKKTGGAPKAGTKKKTATTDEIAKQIADAMSPTAQAEQQLDDLLKEASAP